MSEVKVNKISPRTACGTVTLGDSGDTFTIPAGATITNNGTAAGFGATGAVSWNTAIKTSTITAVNGEGYFVNTTGGAITANLPAGTAGSIVAFKDYLGTFDTNALTIAPNGSQKINGNATVDLLVNTEGESITLVYADDTQGWLVVNDGNNDAGSQAAYVTATGGTITTVCTNYKVHTFTGPGTFTVSCAGNACGSNTVDYLVIAGGGAGGADGPQPVHSAGGGAGGYRESSGAASGCYTASPLGAGVSALPVSVQGYTITVGAGAAAQSNPTPGVAGSGSVSTFSTITSAGGGGGAGGQPGGSAGANGGSGGGGARDGNAGGTGNTPPVSPSQGNNGGPGGSPTSFGGGGGGAGAVGATGGPSAGGAGGNGVTTSINATPTIRSGGGGGSASAAAAGGSGGSGGGGAGGNVGAGGDGTVNTGSGGGGGFNGYPPNATRYQGGGGGSGIVIIRYKFQ